MSDYSKLIAVLVGTLVAWLVTRFALPAEWASPDSQIIVGLTGIINALLVWRFPANKPPA
jgi:hypothetical protein